jgi:hypothetical protein
MFLLQFWVMPLCNGVVPEIALPQGGIVLLGGGDTEGPGFAEQETSYLALSARISRRCSREG